MPSLYAYKTWKGTGVYNHGGHINHGLRGDAADADERYVREFCESRDVPLVVRHVDVAALAAERGLSEEEAGRCVRRDAFEKVMEERGGTKIALAHHMNDNVETLFHNIARGPAFGDLAECGR